MTGLLPPVIRDAIESQTVYAASESFGVVAFVLLVILLLEQEVLRIVRRAPVRAAVVAATAGPLLLAVMLTLIVRVTELGS